MRIAVYAIAHNEAIHAARWADTTAWADVRIVADTGSSDGTSEILAAHGVTVVPITVRPHRFDLARNAALAAVPADVDVCLSLDMDELCDGADFRRMIEAAWDEQPFGSASVWMDSGVDGSPLWWRAPRVHARHGWRWVAPVHEVVVPYAEVGPHIELPCRLLHRPDPERTRTNYLPLLDMAVEEAPGDARMWFYLAREHDTLGHPQKALSAAETVVQLANPAPMRVVEAAACCRIAANAEPDRAFAWLTRGVGIAPHEAEGWAALASHHANRADWPAALEAAQYGLACPAASHHLADQQLRAWGLNNLAATVAWADGQPALAAIYGLEAVKARRELWLVNNLIEYRRACRPGVAVIIPAWNAWHHTLRCLESMGTLTERDRIIVIDNGSTDHTGRGLAEWADRLPMTVITNESNRGFAAACNQGAREASRLDFEHAIFLNSDTICPTGWAEDLLHPFHVEPSTVAAGPTSNFVSGPQGHAVDYTDANPESITDYAQRWRLQHLDETVDCARLVGFCLAVHLPTFNHVGGFVEGWSLGGYEDDDLCRRLAPNGRLVIAAASFVHHHGHASFDANGISWRDEQDAARPYYEAADGR